ncbi:S9 family peptidase [Streptacidiphilus pinicola]|uniref:S9 family peptidase n=1 Tax=Streptacidiphilus pinicola TaxID=2219663 RepID=A0A2X0KDW2_9ACTN|nr:DPP IV N-terminal domain-containing protein [Streptacidiphilus pinicola]RAG85080.1 S9 family peptidase [Streptacidiphilus pinicola]
MRSYSTAEQLMRRRGELVRAEKVRPRWLGDGNRFWYAVNTATGKRFVLVDPQKGIRQEAFDHERLAEALAEASGQDVQAGALPFPMIQPLADTVEFDAFGRHWRWHRADHQLEEAGDPATGNPLEVVAPDGKHAVYRSGRDLRVRALDGSDDRALTCDGTEDDDWGANPDYLMYSTLVTKLGLPHLPPAVAWSADSTRVLTHRTAQHGVRRTHLLRAAPAGGGEPELLSPRFPVPGDEHLPLAEFAVLDVASGTVTFAQGEPVAMSAMSPVMQQWAWWAEDGSAAYYLNRSRDARTLSLHRLDPATGEVRVLVTERGDTRVEPAQQQLQKPNVRVLSGGAEVLWYSQADGHGHLYLYSGHNGEQLAQITSGPYGVQEILRVDEARRTVWFTASGLVGEDPYRRSVCRANLDGTGFTRLTDDDLDHVVTVAPGGEVFVDSASTTSAAPVICVRDFDGRVLVELERTDITGLESAGWSAPERFTTRSADGSTLVYGVLYRPHGFDPAKRYPVIDTPYGLPTANRVSPSFDPGYYGYEAEALAALGFVVVGLDGRGSPGRDKAFHDASYGRLEDACGLDDHVAALRELATDRPWMDLDRVGVTGMSSGGFAAVRALLAYPETYRVGVAESGMHDFRLLEPGLAEAYQAPDDEAAWARLANTELADQLEGELLLIHGGIDDRVPIQVTLRLAERLIAHGKDFELLVVPDADHIYFGYEHYVTQRKWDFLVRRLLGVEPPAGYRLAPVPIDMEALAELFG